MQVKDQLSSLQPYKPGKSPEQMKECTEIMHL